MSGFLPIQTVELKAARSRFWLGGGLLVLCGVLTGCSSLMPHFGKTEAAAASDDTDRPENVYRRAATLPAGLKRVALLPVGTDESCWDLIEGRDALDPVLNAELIRTKKFEVVRATSEDLKVSSGSANWTGEEELPARFLESLQESYGCDAVFFCRLTTFHAYAPLAIGWRMKLVDVHTGQILWAGDELLDSSLPTVRDDARRYQKNREISTRASDGWVIENSPRRFGEYAAAQLLATLPAR
jgi:hypothetical protein